MMTETRYTIEQSYTDELGHLNHVWAIKLLELARDEWYRDAGLWEGRPWSDDETLGTIVVNINVNYRLECFLDEAIVVRTFPLNKGSKSYSIGQELIKANGDIAIDGESTNVIMDRVSHELVLVPESIGQYLQPKT